MMLTDDELTTLISGRYADTGLTISLDAVEQRGRQRRRNSKVALGAGLAAVAVAAIGVAALANRTPTVSADEAMTKDCASRYAAVAGQRADSTQLPASLPPKVVDAKHGKAEIVLYASAPADTVKQVLFECARQADGRIAVTLTAATALGTPVWGDEDQAEYYRDYLPDGSGALVGVIPPGTKALQVTAANDVAVPVTMGGDYFVAWSKFGDLDLAQVNVVPAQGDPYTLGDPVMAGTFNEAAFAAVCVRSLHQPATDGHDYVGGDDPVLRLDHDGERAWVYSGVDKMVVCVYDSGPTSFGTTTYSSYMLGYGARMGIHMFVGDGEGWVFGRVPPDADTASLRGPGGETVTAQVSAGVFGVWVTHGVWSSGTTVIEAGSPANTYEIRGTHLTTRPRG